MPPNSPQSSGDLTQNLTQRTRKRRKSRCVLYHSKLLRYWQEPVTGSSTDTKPAWRFSLEDVHTGERHGFASLAVLVDFLQAQTSVPPDGLDPHSRLNAVLDE